MVLLPRVTTVSGPLYSCTADENVVFRDLQLLRNNNDHELVDALDLLELEWITAYSFSATRSLYLRWRAIPHTLKTHRFVVHVAQRQFYCDAARLDCNTGL